MNTISYTPVPEHIDGQISPIHHPSSLNLVLTRNIVRGEYVHGRLVIDGNFVCHTLENTSSRVPAGIYPISLIKCKQYARKMPCLNAKAPCNMCKKSLNSNPSSLNFVLPCYCPMLKPGNGAHNRLDGSILVGKFNCLGSLIHPKTIFDPLYERIRKSISRGHEVKLTIVDG